MAKYIDCEAAVKFFLDIAAAGRTSYNILLLAVARTIAAFPAADVRPVKRGKWLDDWETGCSECSVCHDSFLWEDFKGVADWNYCPNCGADIRNGGSNGTHTE